MKALELGFRICHELTERMNAYQIAEKVGVNDIAVLRRHLDKLIMAGLVACEPYKDKLPKGAGAPRHIYRRSA